MVSEVNTRQPPVRHDICLFIGGAPGEHIPFGRTRNLSLSGIFLVTKARPAIDTEREISFVWGEETYVCQARVIRHADDGIGLAFIHPADEFIHAIKEVCHGPIIAS
ncbi:MAG: PilZ domain-containing protein [Myxococcota bacterium]